MAIDAANGVVAEFVVEQTLLVLKNGI